MTIAITLKVNDGLVLAADSASTLFAQTDPSSSELGVANIYNNANKIFNLRKGLPLGIIVWGSGSIGPASLSTLIKDLRRRFSAAGDWHIDPDSYRVEEVAQLVREFICDEQYTPAFKDWPQKPPLGLVVAGYGPTSQMADEFMITINNGVCEGPKLIRQPLECGMTWHGEPEAISRLVLGVSPALPQVLHQHLGVPEPDLPKVMQVLQQHLQRPLVMPAMPIQDAIDLAIFLVDATIQYSRFSPGAPTVGGPIEVAAISKHEGFKWVRRKHYYSREFNPDADLPDQETRT